MLNPVAPETKKQAERRADCPRTINKPINPPINNKTYRFRDLIDLHIADMKEVRKPLRRSKAYSLKIKSTTQPLLVFTKIVFPVLVLEKSMGVNFSVGLVYNLSRHGSSDRGVFLGLVVCLSIKTAAEIWPRTLTQVRIMSGIRSMPSIKASPATGTPIASRAGAMVTMLDDGTGATVSDTRNVAKMTAPAVLSASGTS